MKDKQNEGVLGQTNNQALTIGPTQEWRCVHTTSEGTFFKNEITSCSCSWSIKKDYIWG